MRILPTSLKARFVVSLVAVPSLVVVAVALGAYRARERKILDTRSAAAAEEIGVTAQQLELRADELRRATAFFQVAAAQPAAAPEAAPGAARLAA